jgi:phosphate transport system substrate-binding protein
VLKKGLVAALAGLLVLALGAGGGAAMTGGTAGGSLNGAGSTFVSPFVLTTAEPYEGLTGTHINYNPVGSGAGIAAISNRSVDFGASDAPLTHDQFSSCNGCVQVPWALSSTSISYNLPGAPPHLRISGPVLANIYLGKVTKWNDPALKALNPGVSLPDTSITPIFRSDASGTTYNFTDYLSSLSPAWKSKVGTGTQVNFPAGTGGRGSSGVSAVLARTPGGIMYVDIAFALHNHFSFFRVKNAAGVYQLPGARGIEAAAATVKRVRADNRISIVNPAKSARLAYPICTFTYIILPTKSSNAAALRKYVIWMMTNAQKKYGGPLLFEKIPNVVLEAAEKAVKKVQS